jgi:hypothetical protein
VAVAEAAETKVRALSRGRLLTKQGNGKREEALKRDRSYRHCTPDLLRNYLAAARGDVKFSSTRDASSENRRTKSTRD